VLEFPITARPAFFNSVNSLGRLFPVGASLGKKVLFPPLTVVYG